MSPLYSMKPNLRNLTLAFAAVVDALRYRS
jgi:hypothetical protein